MDLEEAKLSLKQLLLAALLFDYRTACLLPLVPQDSMGSLGKLRRQRSVINTRRGFVMTRTNPNHLEPGIREIGQKRNYIGLYNNDLNTGNALFLLITLYHATSTIWAI